MAASYRGNNNDTMETNSNKIPIGQLPPFELTQRLTTFVTQAYFRRSRQLPANIKEMVECLKGDLIKHFKDCPIGTVDDAITTSTLFDNDQQISVAFFFEAVKKKWWQPKTNVHGWNEDDNRRPDYEEDTIGLLYTGYDYIKAHQGDETNIKGKPLSGCIELPAFNARRMYGYLKMRGQLADGAGAHFMPDALLKVNTDRMRTRHHRLTKDEAQKDPDVRCMAMRFACLDWLKACIAQGRKPSDILTPLIDQASYAEYRRTCP